MKKIFWITIFLLCSLQIFSFKVFAQSQETTYRATVSEILEKNTSMQINAGEMFQKLELLITSKGELAQHQVSTENLDPRIEYQVGDKLIIYNDGQNNFFIADQVRTDALLVLALIFLCCVLIISKWKGLGSLLGMAVSFLVIIYFVLPKIASGADPIKIAILGSLLIIPATFYPSHGLNRKTTIAVFSTLLALIATSVLAKLFINFAKLNGLASEEAGFLQAMNPNSFNMQGILLAGIMIGALGVLDDVTVSQAAIVEQLKSANTELNVRELYNKAMRIGHDHIASMVNTLVLVYAGASLPLLLLFTDAAKPFSELVNYSIVAEEIVRTLVGSIGLILAVPISTALSTIFLGNEDNKKSHAHLV